MIVVAKIVIAIASIIGIVDYADCVEIKRTVVINVITSSFVKHPAFEFNLHVCVQCARSSLAIWSCPAFPSSWEQGIYIYIVVVDCTWTGNAGTFSSLSGRR